MTTVRIVLSHHNRPARAPDGSDVPDGRLHQRLVVLADDAGHRAAPLWLRVYGDKELLSRETDPNDRRAARLQLTAKAVQRQEAWREERAKLVEGALAGLAEQEREAIEKALPALRKLLAGLDEERAGA